ncbi:hypothetical protein ACN28E_54770 [Archangium lansingense]|uniref:hypothetical protein n=1 Tax=Archangium lansingense TaxID=2995310 RepID=UPI003B81E9C5
MSQIQREALSKLAGACTLRELKQMHMEATFVQEPSTGQAEVTPELEVMLQIARSPAEPKTEFAAIFRFNVALNTETEPPVAVAKMKFNAILVYSAAEGSDFTDDELNLFGQTNGMVHVWPYLRAFVQNSCAQLGTPVVTLPPFRIGQTLQWHSPESSDAPARS